MLYRYPLDMIASGIEASKWGFNAFGFAPYVGSTPGNFVAGLGNYWIDRVSKMLEFERTASVARARIYYELLCDDPAATVSQLVKFLGLEADDEMIDRTFPLRSRPGSGRLQDRLHRIDQRRLDRPGCSSPAQPARAAGGEDQRASLGA